jgi:hypothetical protein
MRERSREKIMKSHDRTWKGHQFSYCGLAVCPDLTFQLARQELHRDKIFPITLNFKLKTTSDSYLQHVLNSYKIAGMLAHQLRRLNRKLNTRCHAAAILLT